MSLYITLDSFILFKFEKLSGIGPESKLSERSKLESVEMLPNSFGIIPNREFLNINSVSRLTKVPNSFRIVPDRLAPAISRYLSSLILPNCHGMLP
ncbi:hypothetical protein Hanom_Chr07g00607681 [Helianthus anomalus]